MRGLGAIETREPMRMEEPMSTSKGTDQALQHALSVQAKMAKRLEKRGVIARATKSGKFVSVTFVRRGAATTAELTEK